MGIKAHLTPPSFSNVYVNLNVYMNLPQKAPFD